MQRRPLNNNEVTGPRLVSDWAGLPRAARPWNPFTVNDLADALLVSPRTPPAPESCSTGGSGLPTSG